MRTLLPIEVIFWSKVRFTPSCWEWVGHRSIQGYGVLYFRRRAFRAHRAMAEVGGFQIPVGLVSDHLCRNRKCVNPEHIEFVTNKENVLRGNAPTAINAVKTHCIRGHEFSTKNTLRRDGKRQCRECANARNRDRYHRRSSRAPEAGT